MCTLTFDYDWADTNVENDIWLYPPSSVTEDQKKAFEKNINIKYKDYCSRINESGGKIIVGYTKDGTKTMHHVLDCPQDLLLEIQSALN